MAVSIPFLKRVCCSRAISSVEPSSIKEEMALIEGVFVLAPLTLRSSNRRANPPPPAEISSVTNAV
jgi:hypothetical protein